MIHARPRSYFAAAFVLSVSSWAHADDAPATRLYHATDTVNLAIADEPHERARQMLDTLAWKPQRFRITVTPLARGDAADDDAEADADADGDKADTDAPAAAVRFPSPRPDRLREPRYNTVYLEWTPPPPGGATFTSPRESSLPAAPAAAASPKPDPSASRRSGSPPVAAAPARAPAVLILHILDNRLLVERAMARRLAASGVHVFIMHLPGFGERRTGPFNAAAFVTHAAQAISDARRARDAIAALPGVDGDRIALVGTSLGGFIAAPVASLDAAFSPVFIMLAGGDLLHVLTAGTREAAMVRRHLESAGFVGDKLAEVCARMEPTTLAHRLPAASTWLVTASGDQVVPRRCADALAKAAHLPADHHLIIAADHYLGVIHLPWVCDRIVAAVKRESAAGAAAPLP